MASVNKVILIGNLGRDPEMRYTPDGAAICNLSIATTSSWRDRNSGERREETEWHRVSLFGRVAEVAGEYLRKGRPVYIEGRLRTRKWQDKETGQDRYTTEIVGDQMQMLGGRGDDSFGGGDDFGGGYGGGGYQQQQSAPVNRPAQQRTSAPQAPDDGLAGMDDDIPF